METPNNKVLRLAREVRIGDYHELGDSRKANADLDSWPYGELRPEISVERAREIARIGVGEMVELKAA